MHLKGSNSEDKRAETVKEEGQACGEALLNWPQLCNKWHYGLVSGSLSERPSRFSHVLLKGQNSLHEAHGFLHFLVVLPAGPQLETAGNHCCLKGFSMHGSGYGRKNSWAPGQKSGVWFLIILHQMSCWIFSIGLDRRECLGAKCLKRSHLQCCTRASLGFHFS